MPVSLSIPTLGFGKTNYHWAARNVMFWELPAISQQHLSHTKWQQQITVLQIKCASCCTPWLESNTNRTAKVTASHRSPGRSLQSHMTGHPASPTNGQTKREKALLNKGRQHSSTTRREFWGWKGAASMLQVLALAARPAYQVPGWLRWRRHYLASHLSSGAPRNKLPQIKC